MGICIVAAFAAAMRFILELLIRLLHPSIQVPMTRHGAGGKEECVEEEEDYERAVAALRL
jgi:hypothetical protein